MKILKLKYLGLFLLVCSFVFQFVHIDIGISILKPYMIISSILFVFFATRIKITKFYNYEFFWVLFYCIIMLSFFYAGDKMLALQIVLGQFVLFMVFILYRYLAEGKPLYKIEFIFQNVGKIFIIGSILLYLVGFFSYYFFNYTPSQNDYLNDHAIRIYGLYLEGTFPRLMGLAETPNNYAYYANLFLWFFYYKKEKYLFSLALISLLLTISSSAVVVLFIQFLVFSMIRGRKVVIPILCVGIILTSVVLWLYMSNEAIQSIIDYRIDRNMTGSGRFGLWAYVWDMYLESPVFGYGANQSRIIIAPYRELMSTHNSLLEMMLTTGVIGGFVYLLFLFFLLRSSIKLSTYFKTPIFTLLGISFIIYGFSNNTLHIDYVVYYLGFLFIYKNEIRSKSLEYCSES